MITRNQKTVVEYLLSIKVHYIHDTVSANDEENVITRISLFHYRPLGLRKKRT